MIDDEDFIHLNGTTRLFLKEFWGMQERQKLTSEDVLELKADVKEIRNTISDTLNSGFKWTIGLLAALLVSVVGGVIILL